LNGIEQLLANPRVTVRRDRTPEAGGSCVVYWMQRAQRGVDNPALDVAIAAANELQRPVAVFFGFWCKNSLTIQDVVEKEPSSLL
jgi:deoxyribodipyrimidine photo-lyase